MLLEEWVALPPGSLQSREEGDATRSPRPRPLGPPNHFVSSVS